MEKWWQLKYEECRSMFASSGKREALGVCQVTMWPSHSDRAGWERSSTIVVTQGPPNCSLYSNHMVIIHPNWEEKWRNDDNWSMKNAKVCLPQVEKGKHWGLSDNHVTIPFSHSWPGTILYSCSDPRTTEPLITLWSHGHNSSTRRRFLSP